MITIAIIIKVLIKIINNNKISNINNNNNSNNNNLLLEHVEVVNDDPDEQVEGEEGPAHDEYHEVEVVV